jgi:hypothetical protein
MVIFVHHLTGRGLNYGETRERRSFCDQVDASKWGV